jgi:hypothetical protein
VEGPLKARELTFAFSRSQSKWLLFLIGIALAVSGCRGEGPAAAKARPAAATGGAVTFADVAEAAGVRFRHTNGGSGKKYMPETMGSGCAFLDFDGDGWLDIFLVNSRPIKGDKGGTTSALYRNNGDGTFTDVTAGSGLDVPLFGMGCAVGDYDNDGDEDLYVTSALEPCRLFRNEGGGKFRDVTAAAGLDNGSRWGTSAAWVDYDRDGRLDLFVCNYLRYDLAHDIFCGNRLGQKSYCTPRHYDGLPSTLYHNEGSSGRFRDVSRETGIAAVAGKGLGVLVFDVNRDGWPDLFVANDTTPNSLFRNESGKRFTEIGTEAGVAFGENGLARAGMGVDVAALGPKGERAIVVANFSNEPVSFFWEEGPDFFVERTFAAGLARPTQLTLGFGFLFLDYDNDGFADLFLANGHVQDDIQLFQSNLSYAQPHQLFRNRGVPAEGGVPAFEEVGAAAGGPFTLPRVSRGAARGDLDNDGDLDLLVSNNNGPCELLRNEGGSARHWLELRLVGRKSNRSAIGAEARVTTGERIFRDTVRSGSSYCSANMLRLHFGLGDRTQFDAVEVAWPSGRTERWPGGAADRLLTLTEGSGTAAGR